MVTSKSKQADSTSVSVTDYSPSCGPILQTADVTMTADQGCPCDAYNDRHQAGCAAAEPNYMNVPNPDSTAALCHLRCTEGFRMPAPCAGASSGTGGGAGGRKPRKEETAGRKGRGLVGRDLWGFEGRGRIARAAAGAGGGPSDRRGMKTTSFFDREQTRAWGERGARKRSADVVRTMLVWSGARREVKLSSVARQGARRRS